MKKKLLLFPVFVILMAFNSLSAQSVVTPADSSQYPYWISMMQDPNANFFSIQSAFNAYWKNREITKGCGWKPFKRWESTMQWRVTPDGKMPAPNEVKNAYETYISERDNSKSLAGTWVSQGPSDLPDGKGYRGIGRVNAIAFHPTDPAIIYLGAPAGGFWFTTTGGNSWTTTTDMLPTLGVSAIAVDPVNPSIIYIGTGDRDASDAPGMGVYKSLDGGLTWAPSNIGMSTSIVGSLLIDPINPQIIFAGTNSGLFKSIDGGANWLGKSGGFFKDMAFKPGNHNIMYASYSGMFVRSTDNGETWTQITNGIPDGARGVIGVSEANPEVVYLMLAKGDNGFKGLYKSTNSGIQFTEMSNSPNIMDWSCDGSGSGGQAWYDLALTVDPANANTIYTGGVNVWKSIDGGASWQINGHWYGGCGVPSVHADQHIFKVNPIDNKIYIGNDGGIYWTNNGGSAWHEISTGLVISQAYKIGQSATVDDLVINGYQDNGTSLFDDGVWTAVNGGDGMECAIDHVNLSYKYATVYYGSINRINGVNNQGQIAGNGVNGITEEGAWVTPFILDEVDPNIMFIGYKNVWRSENVKAANVGSVKWKKISTINTGNLDVLEQSPINTNILYASSGSALYFSCNVNDAYPSWSNISALLPTPTAISDMEASPYDENTIYIIQDKKIFKSIDRGLAWEDISGSLPLIHFNSIVYYKNSQEGLYLGSDAGVYYKDKSMTDWIPFNDGMPVSASVRELEIYYDPASPAGDKIKAGTFGRGLWKSDMYYAMPVADFTANPLIIPPGCTVNFKDLSSGVPFQWSWNFNGATPSGSTVKNPTNIEYGVAGFYNVELTVTNLAGNNSTTKVAYITVSDTVRPIPGFYGSPQAYCNLTEIVKFVDTSKYCPYAWNWTFSPNTVTFENGTSALSENPEVLFAQSGTYSVTLAVANANGTRSVTKHDYIMAGGFKAPFSEDFESNSFNTKGWTIENPDNEVTWALTEASGSSPGNKAAWMNFFNYPAPAGRRDRLISPVLNFTGSNPIFMTFNHAYASRYSTFSDSLIVYISEDCGVSWERLLALGEKGQGTFATAPKQTTFFAPVSADQWCSGTYGSRCNVIDLTPWANKSNIQIAFESYNKYGNNLYLDNINISSTVSVKDLTMSTNKIQVYPNPTSGMVSIYSAQHIEELTISVFNAQGLLVYSYEVKPSSNLSETINLGNLPKGVYLMKFSGNNTSEQQKLIIK